MLLSADRFENFKDVQGTANCLASMFLDERDIYITELRYSDVCAGI